MDTYLISGAFMDDDGQIKPFVTVVHGRNENQAVARFIMIFRQTVDGELELMPTKGVKKLTKEEVEGWFKKEEKKRPQLKLVK